MSHTPVPMRTRLRLMWRASWPTLLIGVLVVIAVTLLGGNWPEQWDAPRREPTPEQLAMMRSDQYESIGLQNFLVFALAITFLSIKNTIMLQRMGKVVDWVTMTLVSANLAFAALYTLIDIRALFPYWFATHPAIEDHIQDALRIGFVVTLVWGIWTLTGIPDPADDAKGRKLTYTPITEEP